MMEKIANVIHQTNCAHPLRVAVDGVDAAGKTTFADELAACLKPLNRQIIRASVDDFHFPKTIRRKRGELSPEGFYHDSYNYDALESNLLKPLGPNGDRKYRTAIFDIHQDQPIDLPFQTAEEDAILLMDGIFLLRSQLLPYWDLTLYIHADFVNSTARGILRDAELFGSSKQAALRYRERYVPGQQIYLQKANPLDKADILIDNNRITAPVILRPPMDSLIENPCEAKE